MIKNTQWRREFPQSPAVFEVGFSVPSRDIFVRPKPRTEEPTISEESLDACKNHNVIVVFMLFSGASAVLYGLRHLMNRNTNDPWSSFNLKCRENYEGMSTTWLKKRTIANLPCTTKMPSNMESPSKLRYHAWNQLLPFAFYPDI